jgi:peroxiredoxin
MQVGEFAPDVVFTTASREEFSLKDFVGSKNIILAFYPRAFTGG